ncbi:UDP-N-acetylmuramate dehydrogenase [Campylobacter pinnipediorum]|uniref:UDP-N-acetylmuramate dehydrogenase n=1 Tax=Campylobacter pinnipediorum TaxID=1965231 RepID=UPI00084CF698|nr:UDP-N-acetylmuramate dehydrogenase [Campylobacter pinnipediorum]AQW83905.1 UDP-N-acetylenolpyruvoylglucosamine reductase [Campylobacter pinnipediorum subsp. pinnipediorum]
MKKLVNFSKFSSIKVGGNFEVDIINSIKDNTCGKVIIGGANNILLSHNPPKLAMLGKSFDYIKLDENILEVGAATKSSKIYNFAKINNIGNFEFLKNIPGTLGGLIKMNAGLCGISISDNLTHVLLKRGWVSRNEIAFAYRKSGIDETIFGAKFKVAGEFDQKKADEFELKRSNQPKAPSFGSCFVNPKDNFAGKLIEEVGLKGYKIGGAMFSDKHANFLINFNNASFDDVINLIELAKKRVFERFGIELKNEVVII